MLSLIAIAIALRATVSALQCIANGMQQPGSFLTGSIPCEGGVPQPMAPGTQASSCPSNGNQQCPAPPLPPQEGQCTEVTTLDCNGNNMSTPPGSNLPSPQDPGQQQPPQSQAPPACPGNGGAPVPSVACDTQGNAPNNSPYGNPPSAPPAPPQPTYNPYGTQNSAAQPTQQPPQSTYGNPTGSQAGNACPYPGGQQDPNSDCNQGIIRPNMVILNGTELPVTKDFQYIPGPCATAKNCGVVQQTCGSPCTVRT